MASHVRVTDGHREWLATVDGSVVTIDGVDGAFVLTAKADGRWTIEHAGQTIMGTAVLAPGSVWTGIEGSATPWHVQPASSRTRHAAVDDNIRSPMPATVVRVHVSVGSAVSLGDPVVVIEAMKMEMPLRAPRDGVVRAVHCREGELVQPAAVLVELE